MLTALVRDSDVDWPRHPYGEDLWPSAPFERRSVGVVSERPPGPAAVELRTGDDERLRGGPSVTDARPLPRGPGEESSVAEWDSRGRPVPRGTIVLGNRSFLHAIKAALHVTAGEKRLDDYAGDARRPKRRRIVPDESRLVGASARPGDPAPAAAADGMVRDVMLQDVALVKQLR
jgi:hypothetical protein